MSRYCWSIALAGLLFVPLAQAGQGFAGGLRLGTPGLGAEGTLGLSERINLRLGFNAYSDSEEFEPQGDLPENDLTYKGDLDLQSLTALLDLHPQSGRFRFSAGLVSNGNAFGASARCEASSCEVGDDSFTADEIGTLTVDIEWDSIVPYFGIGFGDALDPDKTIGFVFDLGVILQGSGDVDIRSDSPQCDIRCRAALAQEERELQDEADDFDVYPVISLGITWRFGQ